jgi:hypothetical protein
MDDGLIAESLTTPQHADRGFGPAQHQHTQTQLNMPVVPAASLASPHVRRKHA